MHRVVRVYSEPKFGKLVLSSDKCWQLLNSFTSRRILKLVFQRTSPMGSQSKWSVVAFGKLWIFDDRWYTLVRKNDQYKPLQMKAAETVLIRSGGHWSNLHANLTFASEIFITAVKMLSRSWRGLALHVEMVWYSKYPRLVHQWYRCYRHVIVSTNDMWESVDMSNSHRVTLHSSSS